VAIRLFDFLCLFCAHSFEATVRADELDKCLLTGQGPWCRECHGPTMRIWTGMASIQADDVPGGFTIENLDKVPRTFYSKSAYRDELKARGLRLGGHYTGDPGNGSSKPRNDLGNLHIGLPPGVDGRPLCMLSPDEQDARRREWLETL
jgi:hypothetical protein